MQSQPDRSWREIAQQELFEGWQRWTSFACIWAWTCLSGLITARSASIAQLPPELAHPNGVVLVACVVGLFVVLACSRWIKTAIDSPLYMAVAEAFLAGGSVLMAVGALAPASACLIGGAACGGIAIALLKIAWGQMYSRMALKAGLTSMGFSLVASTAVVLALRNESSLVLALALVAASLPTAWLAFKGTAKLSQIPEKPRQPARAVKFSASLLILPAMVGLSCGVAKVVFPEISDPASNLGDASTYASLIAGAAILVSSYLLGRRIDVAQMYSVALIFTVAGLLLISSEAVPPEISYFVHNVGFSLFYFFMVVYWGDLAWRTGMSVVRVYTVGYLVLQAATLVGTMITPPFSHGSVLVLTLPLVLAFFVIALLLLGSPRSTVRHWLVADGPSLETNDEIPAACARLSEQGELSPREREVLAILARGRNASYVARTLCISPDTAKTHIKSIYRKLDVHTQQELMDEIEGQART